MHWYYAKGMKPTEELFQLSKDSIEMFNTAENTPQAEQLNEMREFYDKELAQIGPKLASGHSYERYPTLFSRTIDWAKKEPLLRRAGKEKEKGKGKKRAPKEE